jgi:hypothetical protein
MRARVKEPFLHLFDDRYLHSVRCSSKSKRVNKDRQYVDCPKCLALIEGDDERAFESAYGSLMESGGGDDVQRMAEARRLK